MRDASDPVELLDGGVVSGTEHLHRIVLRAMRLSRLSIDRPLHCHP
jgi:hypothetical protein